MKPPPMPPAHDAPAPRKPPIAGESFRVEHANYGSLGDDCTLEEALTAHLRERRASTRIVRLPDGLAITPWRKP